MQQWLQTLFTNQICNNLIDLQLCLCPFYWNNKNLEFCFDDYERAANWSKIVKKLADSMMNDEDLDTQIMIFPIIIEIDGYESGHSNMLIIDMNLRTIERFDPMGFNGEKNSWGSDNLDLQLIAFFKAVPIISHFQFRPLSTICPNIGIFKNGLYHFQGPQAFEDQVKYLKGEIDGYCSTWNVLYVYLKIHFSDLTQETMSICSSQFQPKELRNIIRYWNLCIQAGLMPNVNNKKETHINFLR